MIKYAAKANGEHIAKACGRNLSISTKHSVEICSLLRGKKLSDAIRILDESIKMKRPIPHRRFTGDVGHKPGMGPGRYIVNACTEIKIILKSVQANASVKGLGKNLVITHMCAHKAATPMKYGRHRRRQSKRTHIEVFVAESTPEKSPAKEEKAPVQKAQPKKARVVKNAPVKKEEEKND